MLLIQIERISSEGVSARNAIAKSARDIDDPGTCAVGDIDYDATRLTILGGQGACFRLRSILMTTGYEHSKPIPEGNRSTYGQRQRVSCKARRIKRDEYLFAFLTKGSNGIFQARAKVRPILLAISARFLPAMHVSITTLYWKCGSPVARKHNCTYSLILSNE